MPFLYSFDDSFILIFHNSNNMNQFKDYYYRSYLANPFSFEHLFCIFTYYLIISIPFYFAFTQKNFWIEPSFDSMTLQYKYTGFYGLQVNYLTSSNVKVTEEYSNIPSSNINSLLDRTVSINDQPNNSTISISLTGYSSKTIISMNGAFFYDVEIPVLQKKVSVAYLFSVPGNFQTATINGQMYLQVSEPINAIIGQSNSLVDTPAYFTSILKAPTSFSQVISQQQTSNFTLASNTFLKKIKGTADTRTLQIGLIEDTQLIVPYYPSLLENLKFKFSRYIAFVMIGYLIFRTLLLVLIKNEALECATTDQTPAKK